MLHRVKFTVQTVKGKEEKTILMRVFLEDGIVSISTMYSVLPAFWVRGTHRVKWNCVNENRQSALEINRGLDKFQELAEKTLAYFDELGVQPSTATWKHQFQVFSGKSQKNDIRIQELFGQFEREKGLERAWSSSNYTRNDTILNDMLKFNPNLKPKDFSKEWLSSFHAHLIKRGMKNSTIKKTLNMVKAFIKWLSENRMIDDQTFRTYKPKIKEVQNKAIIYLEEEELKRMVNLKFPEESKYLEKVRDVFVFACFTGMRYSDIKNLKKRDIYNDVIHFTTIKNYKTIEVELNDISKAILKKYEDRKGQYALPVPQNQHVNRWIKDVALMAQIDQLIVTEHYVGAERITEEHPKWKLITFHSARRTFCSQCVMNGISVQTIMQWTGHASVNEMKPYLALARKFKKQEMEKINFLTR